MAGQRCSLQGSAHREASPGGREQSKLVPSTDLATRLELAQLADGGQPSAPLQDGPDPGSHLMDHLFLNGTPAAKCQQNGLRQGAHQPLGSP